ncbi:MAG: hypothetical protein GXY74_13360 [Phycisphaerae bacterium]|nr:hypothetical protein [Phycisphaerae bacterium]
MSRKTAIDTVNLCSHERPAHCEFTLHHELMERVTGLSRHDEGFEQRFRELWQIDFVWYTNDGPVPRDKLGRQADMGHARFMADGSDFRDVRTNPFQSPDEVLSFDAVEEYGLPNSDDLTAHFRASHQQAKARCPDALVPGGFYDTLVSGAIRAFGWDQMLMAAADQDRFERVLDSFCELALHHFRAWARTGIEAFICHDDMVWTSGPFMHPDFYRRAVFPRYRKLWEVLHEAGIKVIYCCDGNFTMFLDDVAAAGADGFIVEPATSFDILTEKFGRTHVLVGSHVDCRTLTFGTREGIREEIDASLAVGLPCPGWVCVVGNHIAPNVPVDNALFYYDYLSRHWRR